jgi:hypothetical protein
MKMANLEQIIEQEKKIKDLQTICFYLERSIADYLESPSNTNKNFLIEDIRSAYETINKE